MEPIITDIIHAFNELHEQKMITYGNRLYPTKLKMIGVSFTKIKIVLKELRKQTVDYSARQKLKLAKFLVETKIFECQHLAYRFIDTDGSILKIMSEKDVDELGQFMDNFMSVDYYASLVVGPAWREGIITTGKIKSYLTSDDAWIRRIALTSTFAFEPHKNTDQVNLAQPLEICSYFVDEREPILVKALSWVLRWLAKADQEAVLDFIEKYDDRLSLKVVREVQNKIVFGRKS